MIRLVAGADFHRGPLVRRFYARMKEDVVPIFLGDLVNHPRDDAPIYAETVERWAQRNPDLVVVPGNHDPVIEGPWEGVRVHERRGLRILAVPVIPILYKIPMWTHEHSESRIAKMLDPFRGGTYDVIASHAPPHGVCDLAAWGLPIGSTALAAFAQDVSFRLWLCGHVHEQRGAEGRLAGQPVRNAARTLLEVLLVPSVGAQAPH